MDIGIANNRKLNFIMLKVKKWISKSLNVVLILSFIILIFGIIVWDSKYPYWERHTERGFISDFFWAFGIGIVAYFAIWALIKLIMVIISRRFPNLKIYSAPAIIFKTIFLLYFIIFNIIVLVYVSGELPILIRNKKLALADGEKKELLVEDYINEWYEHITTSHFSWDYPKKRFSTLNENDPVFIIIRKLANNNNAIAQYYLGSYYYKWANLEEKDEDVNRRSYYWYYKAANNENPHAQLIMAQFFWKQREIDKSIEYYNKAIKNGNTRANFELGGMYFNSGYLEVAKQIWEDGAKKGDDNCLSELERLEFLN